MDCLELQCALSCPWVQNVINNARVKEHWNCKNLLKFTYLNHKLIQMVPLKQEIIDFIDLGFVLYAVSAILENWPNIG